MMYPGINVAGSPIFRARTVRIKDSMDIHLFIKRILVGVELAYKLVGLKH